MAYVSKQVAGVRVTVKSVMKSSNFRKGFDDVREGRPFDYDFVDRIGAKAAWHYERGRLLATVFEGKLKVGNAVQPAALAAYKKARAERLIF